MSHTTAMDVNSDKCRLSVARYCSPAVGWGRLAYQALARCYPALIMANSRGTKNLVVRDRWAASA